MIRVVVVAALALPACFTEVDVDIAPAEYADWYSIEVAGEVPGHGDSLRRIYANDVALTFTGAGLYPVGTIVVKEIYAPGGDDLRYVAIMRKLEAAPAGGELDDGWLFTHKADLDAPETHRPRCWKTCHQNAPFDGAFLDWSAAVPAD